MAVSQVVTAAEAAADLRSATMGRPQLCTGLADVRREWRPSSSSGGPVTQAASRSAWAGRDADARRRPSVHDTRSRAWSGCETVTRRMALLLGALGLAVVGARWGAEVGISHRLAEVEARLKQLEASLVACRSEARNLEDAVRSCVTDVAVSEDGALRVRHLGGTVDRLAKPTGPLRSGGEVVDMHSQSDLASGSSAGTAGRMATELMRVPAHALLPKGFGSAQKPKAESTTETQRFASQYHHNIGAAANVGRRQDSAIEVGNSRSQVPPVAMPSDEISYPELSCNQVVHPEWLEVKALTLHEFGGWPSHWRQRPLYLVGEEDQARVQTLVDTAVQKLRSSSSDEECGMGRLCMSLLAVAAGSSGSLLGAQFLHAPLLTVLLEVPWRLVLSSGWPFFAILAQLHMRRPRHDAPIAGPAANYFRALEGGLEKREASALAILGAEFLQSDEGRAHARLHVLPGLCALASQLLSPEVGTPSMPVDAALKQVQGFFRQAVQSIEDVQSTLETAWPLYRVLHLAAVTLELG